jgi:hypothetical protein
MEGEEGQIGDKGEEGKGKGRGKMRGARRGGLLRYVVTTKYGGKVEG